MNVEMRRVGGDLLLGDSFRLNNLKMGWKT